LTFLGALLEAFYWTPSKSLFGFTLIALFLGTGFDHLSESGLIHYKNPSRLSSLLIKLRYFLAPWGIVATPSTLILLTGEDWLSLYHELWPYITVVFLILGIPFFKASYKLVENGVRADKTDPFTRRALLFMRAGTFFSLILVALLLAVFLRNGVGLWSLLAVIGYIASIPLNIRRSRLIIPVIETGTLYAILLAGL